MNTDEFEARISAIHAQLISIAAARLSPTEAEDAVQNAALSAWTHLNQLRSDDAFDAWLKKILINECNLILRNKLQQKKTEASIADAAKTAPMQEPIPIFEALKEMNETERSLLLKHHEQGYSISELSKELGTSEAVVKMRLYRARKRLRILLISLLILLLSMAVAVGMGLLDVPWFLANRRANPAWVSTDYRSDCHISYNGLYLAAEITDAIWELDALTLHFTYSLTGTQEDILTVYSGNIGVDGMQSDHIWINEQILPVEEWAEGKTVYTYTLDGWSTHSRYLQGSEDALPDGKGEAFLASMRFDPINPDEYHQLLTENGTIMLESQISVCDYATGNIIEQGLLTVWVSAPSEEEWRNAYEEYYR